MQSILGLLGFLAACFVAASTGAICRPGHWYDNLAKPSWQPPKRIFPIAWTILYIMIAISGWLIWRKVGFAGGAIPLLIYGVQLILNAGWSVLFFGLKRPDLALIEVVLLWLSILATIVAFHPVDVDAALLLVPYFLWVSFASFLNLTICRLNGGFPTLAG